jgi:hypothetical protein
MPGVKVKLKNKKGEVMEVSVDLAVFEAGVIIRDIHPGIPGKRVFVFTSGERKWPYTANQVVFVEVDAYILSQTEALPDE